jgi:hypothetical protein
MSESVSCPVSLRHELTVRLGEELKYAKDNSDTWLGFAVWSVSQLQTSHRPR